MDRPQEKRSEPTRMRVVAALSLAEDIIYAGLGLLLAVYAAALLVRGFANFAHLAAGHAEPNQIIELLDQVLMILLVAELLYTVQVSFREHGLAPEPFLIVAMISVIRRILVLTAQVPQLAQADESSFRHAVSELLLLTVMIVVLVGAVIFLQRHTKRMEAGYRPALPPPDVPSDAN